MCVRFLPVWWFLSTSTRSSLTAISYDLSLGFYLSPISIKYTHTASKDYGGILIYCSFYMISCPVNAFMGVAARQLSSNSKLSSSSSCHFAKRFRNKWVNPEFSWWSCWHVRPMQMHIPAGNIPCIPTTIWGILSPTFQQPSDVLYICSTFIHI